MMAVRRKQLRQLCDICRDPPRPRRKSMI